MTKRQLGFLLVLLGVALIAGLFAADIVGASKFGGIGPAQRLALAVALLILVIGVTLLPLGNRPA